MHNDNVQESLEWLLAHQEEFNQQSTLAKDSPTLKLSAKPDEEAANSSENALNEEGSIEVATMNSLKCDDCGILLKDEDFATLHAHKSGHVNFSQVIFFKFSLNI